MKGLVAKQFEAVVDEVVEKGFTPSYSLLPSARDGQIIDWAALPTSVDPGATKGRGGLIPPRRAERKRWQVESLWRAASWLLPSTGTEPGNGAVIVDFCGGSGHVGLPLAALLPSCHVVVADINAESLEIVAQRAAEANLTNLSTWVGDVKGFAQPFDLALALHACGEATDLTLEACIRARARFVLSPCCVGKMRSGRRQWSDKTKREAEEDRGTVLYPRSAVMRNLVTPDAFDLLASAGDYSEVITDGTARAAPRRMAKSLLEHDRCVWAQEKGYQTRLCRMEPLLASPKNDIILGWTDERPLPGLAAEAFSRPIPEAARSGAQETSHGSVLGEWMEAGGEPESKRAKWAGTDEEVARLPALEAEAAAALATEYTHDEVDAVKTQLAAFVKGTETILSFPPGQGNRHRKLIHAVAEALGLRHWTLGGKKNSQRYAVVEKPPEEPHGH